MSDTRVLQIISNETKDKVCQLDVVTPEVFTNIFMENAKKHKLDAEYSKHLEEFLLEEVAHYLKIQNQTTKQADSLEKSTSKAINAIASKDDETLKEVLHETKQLKKELQKLKESLYKDELTGAYNRKWLYEHFIEERSHLFKKSGVLGLIDLNYFKQINDRYGHIIGDKVLVFIATQLRKISHNIVRYGGDEFLVLCEETSDAALLQKRLVELRESLLKKHLKAKDAEFRVSFSIGTAPFSPKKRLEDVIDQADEKMYEDKKEIKKEVQGIDI